MLYILITVSMNLFYFIYFFCYTVLVSLVAHQKKNRLIDFYDKDPGLQIQLRSIHPSLFIFVYCSVTGVFIKNCFEANKEPRLAFLQWSSKQNPISRTIFLKHIVNGALVCV